MRVPAHPSHYDGDRQRDRDEQRCREHDRDDDQSPHPARDDPHLLHADIMAGCAVSDTFRHTES